MTSNNKSSIASGYDQLSTAYSFNEVTEEGRGRRGELIKCVSGIIDKVPQFLAICVPLQGMKGNLDMTFTSRLGTMAHQGRFKSGTQTVKIMRNMCLIQVLDETVEEMHFRTFILVYLAEILVYSLFRYGLDPDMHAIPLLTSIGDLMGTSLLFLLFYLMSFIRE
ncbi:unnamed protein product [Heligmosomoides polygyrus]|uniref:MgtE domain-containing protein n=1 Tax=Heligmosomoides polygyrus TaxID=6339 RepID=A0A3P8AIF2_HELPZ|nr:unnamed protein product [Heligmosomoides polygyrus]